MMARLGAAPKMTGLSTQDINFISAMPIDYVPDRVEFLCLTLEEWQGELADHLEVETYATAQARTNRLKQAFEAFEAAKVQLRKLSDEDVEFLTVHRVGARRKRGQTFADWVGEFSQEAEWVVDFLDRLSGSAPKIEMYRTRATVWPLLVMRDLAAIYRFFTKRVPVRSEGGPDMGPFADFSQEIWERALGKGTGWHAAMKKWDRENADNREHSAFMANFLLRHPEWRVLSD